MNCDVMKEGRAAVRGVGEERGVGAVLGLVGGGVPHRDLSTGAQDSSVDLSRDLTIHVQAVLRRRVIQRSRRIGWLVR